MALGQLRLGFAFIALIYIGTNYHRTMRRAETQAVEWGTIDNVLAPPELDQLLSIVKDTTLFSASHQDTASSLEGLGEGVPVQPDGSCLDWYREPNSNRTLCIFPERLDVWRHYLWTGGYHRWREGHEQLRARVRGFDAVKDRGDLPALEALFVSPQYLRLARVVCAGRPVLDPFEFVISVNLPGQETAMQYDVPSFQLAGGQRLPQWLLVAMGRSGLFNDTRIPQLRGVAFLHEAPATGDDGGGFYFYSRGFQAEPTVVDAVSNTAVVLDGTASVHGTASFRPEVLPPRLLENHSYELTYDPIDDLWHVLDTTDVANTRRSLVAYATRDLRVSLTWRARCFKTEEEREQFNEGPKRGLSLDEILLRFHEDLLKRGKVPPFEDLPAPGQLAWLLVDEYIRYPVHGNAFARYNYCLAARVWPWLGDLLGC